MRLLEILPYVAGEKNIVIYAEEQDGYTDLYRGKPSGLPEELLNLSIHSIGAARAGVLDICVNLE